MPEDNPNFLIKEWTPQIELLTHPAVKAFICHCGFGGTNDAIITGTVPILFPHFDDQHYNADLFTKAKCGPTLCNVVRLTSDLKKMVTYEKKMFDEKHVTKIVKDALENPEYQENILKLRLRSEQTGGRDLLVKSIERHYIAGCDHLVDKDLVKKYYSMSALWGTISTLIVLGIFAALICFTVLYFMDDE